MKKYDENEKILDEISIDKGNNAISHTETTGLIPTLATDDYEINSYQQINEYFQKPISGKEKHENR